MPFWLVKLSESPDCSVPAEIVTVAPVRFVSWSDTITPASTGTAPPPTRNVLVVPDGLTTKVPIEKTVPSLLVAASFSHPIKR